MFSELWIKAETLIACSRTGEISKPVEKLDPFICIPVHKQEWIGIFFFNPFSMVFQAHITSYKIYQKSNKIDVIFIPSV